jgi:hypothetical protein
VENVRVPNPSAFFGEVFWLSVPFDPWKTTGAFYLSALFDLWENTRVPNPNSFFKRHFLAQCNIQSVETSVQYSIRRNNRVTNPKTFLEAL